MKLQKPQIPVSESIFQKRHKIGQLLQLVFGRDHQRFIHWRMFGQNQPGTRTFDNLPVKVLAQLVDHIRRLVGHFREYVFKDRTVSPADQIHSFLLHFLLQLKHQLGHMFGPVVVYGLVESGRVIIPLALEHFVHLLQFGVTGFHTRWNPLPEISGVGAKERNKTREIG